MLVEPNLDLLLSNEALDELLSSFSERPPNLRGVKIRHLVGHYDRFASKPVDTGPAGGVDGSFAFRVAFQRFRTHSKKDGKPDRLVPAADDRSGGAGFRSVA